MSLENDLQNIEEPKEIKRWMVSLEANYFNDPSSIDWPPLVLWYGNRLPQYLWNKWKNYLKPRGFTWQKFTRLLRYRTDIGVLWYKGILPWNKFIKEVIGLVDGPIGASLAGSPTPKQKAKKG